MNASDVMVRDVVTVAPHATVQDVTVLLLKNRISALPVVDETGKLVGIISEGDLLHRAEAGTERKHSWWLRMFASSETMAAEFVKSHAHKVSDVMTKKVVTAAPGMTVREIASMLERHGIKRVPVVDNGKLIGIVSRANLIQALATIPAPPPAKSDALLREEIMAKISAKSWARPSLLNAIVHDGTVELWGTVSSDSEKNAVRVLAEIVPGVRAVKDNVTVRSIEGWV